MGKYSKCDHGDLAQVLFKNRWLVLVAKTFRDQLLIVLAIDMDNNDNGETLSQSQLIGEHEVWAVNFFSAIVYLLC